MTLCGLWSCWKTPTVPFDKNREDWMKIQMAEDRIKALI